MQKNHSKSQLHRYLRNALPRRFCSNWSVALQILSKPSALCELLLKVPFAHNLWQWIECTQISGAKIYERKKAKMDKSIQFGKHGGFSCLVSWYGPDSSKCVSCCISGYLMKETLKFSGLGSTPVLSHAISSFSSKSVHPCFLTSPIRCPPTWEGDIETLYTPHDSSSQKSSLVLPFSSSISV